MYKGLKEYTEDQCKNIKIDTDKFNREIIEQAIKELQDIESIDNAPTLSTSYLLSKNRKYVYDTCTSIKFGRWTTVLCDNTDIKIENRTISIPDIPYTQVKSILFKTFFDKSKLIGVWIILTNGLIYKIFLII